MSRYSAGKKIITVFAFLAISISVSSMESACDAADGANLDKWMEGAWTGQIETAGGNRSVNIDISSPANEPNNKELKYSDPRGCTIKAQYVGTADGNGLKYVVTMSNGGFCDNLLHGALSLKRQGKDRLGYEVNYTDNKSVKKSENGQLWPAK